MKDLIEKIEDDLQVVIDLISNKTCNSRPYEEEQEKLNSIEHMIIKLKKETNNKQDRIVNISEEFYKTTLEDNEIQTIIESYNVLYTNKVYEDYFRNYIKSIGLDSKLELYTNIDRFEL